MLLTEIDTAISTFSAVYHWSHYKLAQDNPGFLPCYPQTPEDPRALGLLSCCYTCTDTAVLPASQLPGQQDTLQPQIQSCWLPHRRNMGATQILCFDVTGDLPDKLAQNHGSVWLQWQHCQIVIRHFLKETFLFIRKCQFINGLLHYKIPKSNGKSNSQKALKYLNLNFNTLKTGRVHSANSTTKKSLLYFY